MLINSRIKLYINNAITFIIYEAFICGFQFRFYSEVNKHFSNYFAVFRKYVHHYYFSTPAKLTPVMTKTKI